MQGQCLPEIRRETAGTRQNGGRRGRTPPHRTGFAPRMTMKLRVTRDEAGASFPDGAAEKNGGRRLSGRFVFYRSSRLIGYQKGNNIFPGKDS